MKKILLVLGLMFISNMAFNQEGPTVVVFNSPDAEEEDEYGEHKNFIKFNVMEAFAGDFSFYYERLLHKNFSAEVGIGVTLSDYFGSLISSDFDVFDQSYESLLGNSFALGLRYYPNGYFDDFYFSPDFKYKKYNNRFVDFSNGIANEIGKESRAFSVGRISFGYNYFVDDKIFIDLSGGFGIGQLKIVDYTAFNDYDPITGNYTTTYEKTELKRLVPRIHVGFKIGIAF